MAQSFFVINILFLKNLRPKKGYTYYSIAIKPVSLCDHRPLDIIFI